MLRLTLAFCLTAFPTLGLAECLTAESAAKGVVFKRQDGSNGRLQSDGGKIVIDYVTGRDSWEDERSTLFGVYELSRYLNENEGDLVGSAPPSWTWKFSPKVVMPEAGGGWAGKVKQVIRSVTYGDEMKEFVSEQKGSYKASYTFQAETTAKLSGCTYRMIPVEAVFTGPNDSYSQRWVFFPDLGFGLETKRDGAANGLVAMKPV